MLILKAAIVRPTSGPGFPARAADADLSGALGELISKACLILEKQVWVG